MRWVRPALRSESSIRLDEQFVLVEQLVEEGRAFFVAENLARLKSIPLSEKDARLTRSVRWEYDAAKAKGK